MIKLRSKIIILFLIIFFTIVSHLNSESDEPIGARPAGMGDAYTAVSDDGNALSWNSAGMVFLNRHEITSMYTDLFDVNLKNYYIAYIYPVSTKLALGLDWFNIGYHDDYLNFDFNKFNLGLSYRFNNKTAFGGTFKYFNTQTSFETTTVGKGAGYSIDAGVLYKYSEKLSVGIMIKNLFNADISYTNGGNARWYDQQYTLGFGYKLKDNVLLAMDINDRLHVGGEYQYKSLLALRTGFQRDLSGEKETVLSFGTGLKFKAFNLDYSYTVYPYLANTAKISMSASFNFGYSLIQIKSVKIIDNMGLFPSMWKTYQQAPFLEFTLVNKSNQPLTANWEMDLPGLTDEIANGDVILRPKEEKTIYATVKLSESFYSNDHDLFKPGNIKVSYRRERDTKSEKKDYQVFIYSRGAIDWNADMNRVAAFINPQDSEIRKLSVDLLETNDSYLTPDKAQSNILKAMVLYNGLKSLGIQYISDPNNPYSDIKEKGYGIDDVQYPVEFINSKRGDCDDLTVLYATMLESIGIETIIIDVPGHIYLMFNSGVSSIYKISLMLPDYLLVNYKGYIYIPIEITEIDAGFMTAWSVGASEYYRWESLESLNQIEMHNAWAIYPPVPLHLKFDRSFQNLFDISTILSKEISTLTEYENQFMSSNFADKLHDISKDYENLNDSAVTLIQKGDLIRSDNLLKRIIEDDHNNILALNNLANLLHLKKEYADADSLYSKLLDLENKSPVVLANILISQCDKNSFTMDYIIQQINLYDQNNENMNIYSGLRECVTSYFVDDCKLFNKCVMQIFNENNDELMKQDNIKQSKILIGERFIWLR